MAIKARTHDQTTTASSSVIAAVESNNNTKVQEQQSNASSASLEALQRQLPVVPSLTTCIVGGGNSAHVLVPFLSEAGHRVHLLTRRPDDWSDVVYCEVTDGDTNAILGTHAGRIDAKSSNPGDVIPAADIVVLCLPVHQYRPALDRIAPFLNKYKTEVFVGTLYGQGGFNWMVRAAVEHHKLTNIVTFAMGEIPWICRASEYGKLVANYGGKTANTVAVSPPEKFGKLDDVFLRDISLRPLHTGAFTQVSSFLSLTMSVDNQLIHPARCYGLFERYHGGKWTNKLDVPYFYRDFDRLSARNIRKIDEEYSSIRAAIRERFPHRDFKYMLSYLELEDLNHHGSSSGGGGSGRGQSSHHEADMRILSSLKDSKQLATIKTPTFQDPTDNSCHRLNHNCRFFTDDIPYGLLIGKWIAQELGVETPFIDKVITWAQNLRGEEFLDENTGNINKEYCLKRGKYASGIPESYGITSVDDILD